VRAKHAHAQRSGTHDIERLASNWLHQIETRELSTEQLAEFDAWLSNPSHEIAVAQLLIAILDAKFFAEDR
jgi:hypothetical protein